MQTCNNNSHDGVWPKRSLSRPLKIASVCCLGLATLGCSQGYQMAKVSGLVTLDGKPLASVRVVFEPLRSSNGQTREVRGPLSSGRTDEQGRFVLEAVDGQQGAVVGPNCVRFSTRTMDADFSDSMPKFITVRKESLPARYNLQSDILFEVPEGGADEANFALKSK